MRYFHLVLCMLFGATVFAQGTPSASFFLPNVEADNNTEVCLPVTTRDFTGGVEFSFALRWTPPSEGGGLDFSRIDLTNTSIPNLDLADFNLTDYLASGLITVEWGNYANGLTCADSEPSITIDDGSILFEVCFNVSGAIASRHDVEFFNLQDFPDTPEDETVDVAFVRGLACTSLFPNTPPGTVVIGVKPLLLDIPEVEGIFQPGDPPLQPVWRDQLLRRLGTLPG